jgi:hypothetical protein
MSTAPRSQQALSSQEADDRRIAERHDLTGRNVRLLVDATVFTLHLKDLSRTGLCGLTDAPLAPGQMVCLLFDKWEPVPAQIRWIRKALIGAAFPEPLPAEMVGRLKRKAPPRRIGR